MELKLNLPNIIRRLKLTTKSIKSNYPIWKGLDNVQLSTTDNDPREKSALYWLFGFALPEMHCEVSTTECNLYTSEKYISSLKQIESHIVFTKLAIKPLGDFKFNEAAGHIKSTEPSKTNLYEAFSHLMSVKDNLEQSYFTIGGLFLSELLKRKFVPLIENKALTESNSDFKVFNYGDEAFKIARDFVPTFVSTQNNKDKDKDGDESSDNEKEEILSKSFLITKEKMGLVCYRIGDAKIFTISLQVSFENYESSLNRTIIVDPDSQGKLEKVYNMLLETFRRNLLKCKNENKLIDAIDTNTKYIKEKCNSEDFIILTFFGNMLNISGFEDSIFTLSKNKHMNRVGDVLCVKELSEQNKLTSSEIEEIQGLVVPKEKLTFKQGMVFTINSVALLKPSFFKDSGITENVFLNISDMTLITSKRVELLTHCGRKFGKISYFSSSKQIPKQIEIDLPKEEDSSTVVDGVRRSTRIQKAIHDATSKGFKALSRIDEGLERNKTICENKIARETATLINISESRNSGGSNDNNKAHLEIIEKLKEMNVKGLKNVNDFPHIKSLNNNIQLDDQREILFFPILGRTVPISLHMIKTVTFSEIGDVGFLRFSFNADNIVGVFRNEGAIDVEETPGAKLVVTKVQIKELNFKSKKIERLTGLYQHVRNCLRDMKARIKEKIEKKGLIKQDTLMLKNDPVALRDIQMKPVLGTRRKAQGRLEIHSNGLRFTDTQNHKLDVLFSNILFAVFQPAFTTECLVLIHFQLKFPVLANKKQTEYVQFFFDSVSSSVDIATKYSTYSGNDEQRNIKRFTAKFKNFVNTTEELMSAAGNNIRFELPDKDLMFDVNLQRNMTPMFLCERSLIALNDTIPLLIQLKDIRMIYFERMVVGSKSFDMAVVFHDIFRDVIRVSNISKQESDIIKIYFEKAGVKVLEGHVNMDWKTIVSEIRKDPRKFAEESSWKFLEDSEGSDDEFEDKQEEEEEAVSSEDLESDGNDEEMDEDDMSGGFTGDDAIPDRNEDVSDVVDWDEETGSESG
eukprot:GAHX01000939.1.p1 GENE.GAHX01000939.1~~GAHX01000939.1.p1  ORF type:complete len:1025 (-),score=265.42 GAHX01000939.1:41-3115(-)